MQFKKFATHLLSEIKKAKHILLNVHKSPDLDSVGSSCAMAEVLLRLGKKVTIVSPGPVDKQFSFIKGYNSIKCVQFDTFDYAPYDLVLLLDVSSFDRVTGSKKIALPDNLNYAVIDHHTSNQFKYPLTYVNENAHSTTEILFDLFRIWKIVVTPQVATALYAGLAGDTVHFRYMNDAKKVFQVAQELLSLGADHLSYMKHIYSNIEVGYVKLIGRFLEKTKLEKSKKGMLFSWTGISYSEYTKYGTFPGIREAVADDFLRNISGTQFGLVLLETVPGEVSVSFRSNIPFDVSPYARALGGGGHAQAAGCTLLGKYEEIVKRVLSELGKGKG